MRMEVLGSAIKDINYGGYGMHQLSRQYDVKQTHQLIDRYLELTNNVLPEIATQETINWPVKDNHCFQRIVLDAISNGVWQKHIASPAYKNMTPQQLKLAIILCEAIASGTEDLTSLNMQSLNCRKQQRTEQLTLDL